ncbi:MAG TPA: T9SS type A sorting domain-containing protein, partial [Bacteroidota bacterium]|nr:T9SS type A sorting domain-containing protein [Bacteroidota bacterium]
VGISTASLSEAELFFGEWPGAGEGIDSLLGETELGPLPPAGTFDARWDIPGTNGSLTDIRDTLGSPGDTNVFTLRLRTVPSDYPILIRWDRDNLGVGAWRMMDTLSSGGMLNADMWQTGEAVISDTSMKAVTIVHTMVGTIPISVRDKWSLVSLPVTPTDSSVAGLFPDALPRAYSFGTAYAEEEFLSAGTGYWIKNAGAVEIPLTGVPFNRNTISNAGGGWLLLGSVYCPLPRSVICPSCVAPPVIYGYRTGYYIPDTLFPGEGYWYRGTNTLDLDCRLSAQVPVGIAETAPAPLHALEISDGAGGRATLRFGRGRPPGEPADRYGLPPVPPGPAFDARFETENSVAYFEGGTTRDRIGILISNARGDLLITCRGNPAPPGQYALELSDASGTSGRYALFNGFSIVSPAGATVRLLLTESGGTPGSFRVHGNYPNPFNPRTSIRYDLPAPAHVSLWIRNIAGQEVGVPVADAAMPAGQHVLDYDAGDLSSGVYFYTLTARASDPRQSGRHTGKFILLK